MSGIPSLNINSGLPIWQDPADKKKAGFARRIGVCAGCICALVDFMPTIWKISKDARTRTKCHISFYLETDDHMAQQGIINHPPQRKGP